MIRNEYVPFLSKIKKVIKHTDIEYTFRMEYVGEVKPGQFFEISIPKYGEAPISVSGIDEETIDFTIRKVGKVTNEVFEKYEGDSLYLRGPYGNGFDVENYKGKELLIVAGGTGVSPVRGIIDYFARNSDQVKNFTIITGFKSESDILFKDDFKRWKSSINVVLTVDNGEVTDWYKVGMVTKFIPEIKLDNVGEAAAIVVGPPAMMKFSVACLLERGFLEKNIWISQERKMCCGIGKCGHCKIGDTYVCLEGPVFNYTKGKNLID